MRLSWNAGLEVSPQLGGSVLLLLVGTISRLERSSSRISCVVAPSAASHPRSRFPLDRLGASKVSTISTRAWSAFAQSIFWWRCSALPRNIPVLRRRKHDFADIACPVGLAKYPKIAVKAIGLVALGTRSSSGMLVFVRDARFGLASFILLKKKRNLAC